jgi:hypothetical protein
MPWWWGYTETVLPCPPRLHRISTLADVDPTLCYVRCWGVEQTS